MNEIRAVSFCFPVPEQEQGAWQKIRDYNLSSFYSEDMDREVELEKL